MAGRKQKHETALKPVPSRARRIFFNTFKWCRVAVLLFLLVVIILGLFLNKVGLPDSIRRRLIAQVRAAGWNMEFSQLRLRWYRGLVAENLHLARTNAAAGPQIFVETAELHLNGASLRKFKFDVDAARLGGGRLIWPMAATNRITRSLLLERVRGELFFQSDDLWELRSLDAALLGVHLHCRGEITNASLVRDWRLLRPPPQAPPQIEPFWNRLLTVARKVHFGVEPELTAFFYCDARDFRSLAATMKFIVPSVDSPWASVNDVRLTATLVPPPGSNDLIHTELKLNAANAHGPWGSGTRLQASLLFDPSLTHLLPTNASATVSMEDARTRWGDADRLTLNLHCRPSATNAGLRDTDIGVTADRVRGEWGTSQSLRLEGSLRHSATNLLPAAVHSVVQLEHSHTRWATSDWARIVARAEFPSLPELRLFHTNLAWPERWANLPIHVTSTCSNSQVWKLDLASVALTNHWQPPLLRTELAAQLPNGELALTTDLDAPSRRISFNGSGRFEPHQWSPLFSTNLQEWIAGHRSDVMPRFQAAGMMTLPAWTNQQPDWRGEVLPTLSVSGMLDAGAGTYRDVSYNSAHALFLFTNLFLTAPEIRVVRSEGMLDADYAGDTRSGEFRCRVRSSIDPKAVDPLVHRAGEEDVLDLFQFTAPPGVNALLQGNHADWNRLGVDANVALTNVTFRGVSIKSCTAQVLYTNQLISILRPLVLREGERGEAAGIGITLTAPRLHLTNASGNLAPMAVATCIGDHIVRVVKPYVFDTPPAARVAGTIPLGKSDGTENMRFEIEGGPFHWQGFNLERVKSLILWRGSDLAITNVQGVWHGGEVHGWTHFDFAQPRDGLFNLSLHVEDADLRTVVRDIHPGKTNKLEGRFGGDLVITQAYIADFTSWQGHGSARLTNGLIWDIPVFGLFSPVLNAFAPGLGNSRAKQGAANFVITNSVIYSRDLEIRATAMRMQYQGTLDFEGHLDARMEAELLRNLPAIGFVISKVLWPVTKLFEYKMSGTLDDPKADPLYVIPRVVLFPFQPIKTIKDLLNAGDEKKPPEIPPLPPPDPPK